MSTPSRVCANCGAKRGVGLRAWHDWDDLAYCADCWDSVGKERAQGMVDDAEKVLVSTTDTLDGYRVTNYRGVESAEVVIGTAFLSELSGDLADFLGARSTAFEKKLSEAKTVAFLLLKMKATRAGGNAVIGVDLDYTEFTKNRIGLIVNGTVVTIEPR